MWVTLGNEERGLGERLGPTTAWGDPRVSIVPEEGLRDVILGPWEVLRAFGGGLCSNVGSLKFSGGSSRGCRYSSGTLWKRFQACWRVRSQALTCIPLGCVWPHQCSCRISPVDSTSVKWVHSTHSPPQLCPTGLNPCLHPSTHTLQCFSHLEELHTDAGKHELQECSDNHDVPDGPDGHEHALHNML